MISLESKTTLQSKIWPDITFTIRKYTEGVRQELRRLIGSAARELNEANADAERLRQEYRQKLEHDPIASPSAELLNAIDMVNDITRCRIQPAYVRVAFVSAEGVQMDGGPLTADGVIELAPQELYTELYTFIAGEYGLTEREKGESEPPTTSGEAEGGSTSLTNAESVSARDTTSPETVDVISQTT